jgi:hypothetical protein
MRLGCRHRAGTYRDTGSCARQLDRHHSSTAVQIGSSSTFFDAAEKVYEEKAKKDLQVVAHPPAARLQSCNSSSDIIPVLQNELDQPTTRDERESR